ncbi:hypothetical protein NE237_013504 [Protea cynaroides]|uniref:SET domain-containing protein n=1 Tax=Protea cynaroides TaxID=273540 RepID=A0A9Q0GYV6_9MAGN|nr:hypothetical protein NE237_013504 [Protea cynaroides]
MVFQEEAKLELFLQWLQANRVELRGCKIKCCGPSKGFGIFSSNDVGEEILLVVPLDLAITPMRVLQDPSLGPKCRAMFEEGEVDDRFLMILFLTVERLRKNSSWKPYLDMLPTTFGNPLWFTDDELQELKGTTLYRATELQKKELQSLYDNKVKDLVKELLLLDGDSESEVQFGDFLWANSIFWTRALNIPCPRAYVFPQMPEEQENCCSIEMQVQERAEKSCGVEEKTAEATSPSPQGETVWVEGLVPGIDFCNHDLKPAATWEVDGMGLVTGVPSSMYLLSADQIPLQIEKEICISYGNKGNEELLYLYGFVINNNPDDFLMVHYPVEAFRSVPFTETKAQLLETQMAEMRCLLPRTLLDRGFFSTLPLQYEVSDKHQSGLDSTYSWSGQRKKPSYLNKLVFPEEFLTALRTIAMQEEELLRVSKLLEELGYGEERQPSAAEVRAAVWEACGDSGALQLLVDLLHMKMMELEEGSGTEDCDTELLEKAHIMEIQEEYTRDTESKDREQLMSKNRWSCIVYRRGQKHLTRLFLREAENALQLCLSEQS